MPVPWTLEQIWGVAPDLYNLRISRNFAQPERWQGLGCDSQVAWGEFPLTNKPPYQTAINLSTLAFSCSCLSRKFPCTHSLSLLLLYIERENDFSETSSPDWAARWLQNKQPAPQRQRAAQVKATRQRLKNIRLGLGELDLWLRDLVRSGLAVAQSKPPRYWTEMADRLVDAQIGEIAQDIRLLANLTSKQPDAPEKILRQIGQIHVLIQGFQNYESLPVAVQADLRAAAGWLPKAEDIDPDLSIGDRWHIVGRRIEQSGKQLKQRTWLWGERSHKPALIIDLAHNATMLDVSLVAGAVIEADLNFYRSAAPLRAHLRQPYQPSPSSGPVVGYASIPAAMSAYSQAITANPWLRHFPMLLASVMADSHDGHWFVRDSEGYVLPLPEKYEHGWHVRALGRGLLLSLFGEWDGQCFHPLSLWQNKRLLELHILRGIS